jgi:hypothetical protein
MKTNTGTGADNIPLALDGSTQQKLPGVCLQQLVNQLLKHSMSVAFKNKSLVTNEIPREVEFSKDKISVAPVLRNLLSAIITNSRDGEIYISADRFRDIITLQVQERNNYNGYALEYSIKALEREAIKIGASILIDGAQKKVITVSFSFPGQANQSYDC